MLRGLGADPSLAGRHQLRKVHAQARAMALTAAVRWEQEQPTLKVSRADLTKR